MIIGQLPQFGFALGLLYIMNIHIAYFLFNSFFGAYYNQKIKYSSIWYLGFKMEEIVR